MKNTVKIIIAAWGIFSCLISTKAMAQEESPVSKIESLLVKLPSQKPDTNKVNLLFELSGTYRNLDPASGVKYGMQGLDLATKLHWEKGIAKMNQALGNNYLVQADYTNALDCFFKAMKIHEALNNSKGMAASLCNIGAVYDYQNEFNKAIEYYFKAIKILEQTGDKKTAATVFANIGAAYSAQNDEDFVSQGLNPAARFKIALDNYFKSLKIFEELADKDGIALNYGNIADAYTNQKDYLLAIEYGFKALEISATNNNKFSQAYNLGNISDAFLNMAKEEDFQRSFGNKSITLPNIGYQRISKPFVLEQAGIYLNKAIQIDEEIGELNELQKNYRCLSELEALRGNYRLALNYFQMHAATKDSVYSEANKEKIVSLEKQRSEDINTLNKRLAALQLETSKNKGRYYIAGLSLVMLLIFLVFRNFSIRNKLGKTSLFKRAFVRFREFSTNKDDVSDLVIRKMSILMIACATSLAAVIWALMYYFYYGICYPFFGPIIYF